jgi:hypothetical protein
MRSCVLPPPDHERADLFGTNRLAEQIQAVVDNEPPFRIPIYLYAFRNRRGAPLVILRQIALGFCLEKFQMLCRRKMVNSAIPFVSKLRITDHSTFVGEIGHRVVTLQGETPLVGLRGNGSKKAALSD